MVFDEDRPFSERHVEILKDDPREKRHKWYSGLPIHIKSIFMILNILLFISIIMNSYILLVSNRPYIRYNIALRFAYGLPMVLPATGCTSCIAVPYFPHIDRVSGCASAFRRATTGPPQGNR